MDLTIRPITVQAQVAAKLREAIFSGVFAPGEKLVESALCQSLNVSRSSVREALRRLEAERLVTIKPNYGPAVAKIGWKEAEAIYEMRALLEGQAAAGFTRLATEDDFKRMRAALKKFKASENDPMPRIAATSSFYEVMISGCGNPVLGDLLGDLVARINYFRAQSMSLPNRAKQSALEMQRLLDALESRDPEAARSAAIEHVNSACAAVKKVLLLEDASQRLAS